MSTARKEKPTIPSLSHIASQKELKTKRLEDSTLLHHKKKASYIDEIEKDSLFYTKDLSKDSFAFGKHALPPIKGIPDILSSGKSHLIDFDPRKNIKTFRQQTDNIYITQLKDKSDKSFSLSYKKRRDEEMFSKVSQIPLFAEFKQEYEDHEKSKSFLSKYLNAQSHYLDLDSFIKKLENLEDILNPIEKYKAQKELNFEGLEVKTYIFTFCLLFSEKYYQLWRSLKHQTQRNQS